MRAKKKIAIIGYGLEGESLFFYLRRDSENDITILDRNPEVELPKGSKSVVGASYLKNLWKFDQIFRSPGVPFKLPEIQKQKNKVTSLTKLFFEEIRKKDKVKIIGITGSAGKTTTSTLIFKMLKNAGKDAYLVGNIGVSFLDVLNKLSRNSIVVAELSSFQLQDLTMSPDVALVLDVFEEHLDRHKDFREYFRSKENIVRFQNKKDAVIYFADNKNSKKIVFLSRGKKIPVTAEKARNLSFETRLIGGHNLKNILAASLAATLFGVSEKIIKKTVKDFKGAEHRIEFVGSVNGVKFYNDSKATNVGEALASINIFEESKIVLMGGFNKKLNLKPLAKRAGSKDIRFVGLFGPAGGEIARFLKSFGIKKYIFKTRMWDAFIAVVKKAKRGDIFLLAPGAASFDEFHDYKERGREFKKLVTFLNSRKKIG